MTRGRRLVVTEYPKSGGTWLVSMVGDALSLPKRDIYIKSGYRLQDLTHHPWYAGAPSLELTESCVIKSHEPPASPLLDFSARFVHLVRDGRDVVVSRYFFEKDFCVKNGILERFEVNFDEYVTRIAADWKQYVLAWVRAGAPMLRYEQLLADPAAGLADGLGKLGVTIAPEQVHAAVAANTKQKLHQQLSKAYRHNTFVRKGQAGDWRNHFSPEQARLFKATAGDLLVELGYEADDNWVL